MIAVEFLPPYASHPTGRDPCVINGRYFCVCGDSFQTSVTPRDKFRIKCDCGRIFESEAIRFPGSNCNPPTPECSTPPAPVNDATDGGTLGHGGPAKARESAAVRDLCANFIKANLRQAVTLAANVRFELQSDAGVIPTPAMLNAAINLRTIADTIVKSIERYAMNRQGGRR